MKIFFTIFIWLITFFPSASQDNSTSKHYQKYQIDDDTETLIVKRKYSPEGEEIIADEEINSTENTLWIIEFRGDPVIKSHKNGRVTSAVDLSIFQKFEDDLGKFNTKGNSSRVERNTTEIKHKYYKSFFGVSADFPESIKSKINDLPYVKRVIPDIKVKIQIAEESKIIKADTFKSLSGVDGSGIKIGVIDTGIDYNHPDLGGGFGDGFKVKGGYDFVNSDDDPIDNHGHGTHVAGIIAAEGSELTGIAPKAELYALKALNVYGDGYTSDIISAIEWTIDPNNDNDFSDKLDIVNMSLGGSGDANDPLSKAVDNAVEAGIIYCVAAGNDRDYYKIGSPGTARNAITVGSISMQNYISEFSSKGPTPDTYLMKPDVVAPGESIYSTYLDNTYQNQSGTSMATPFVTGAAALLLQKHQDWSPEELKFAIMNSASKLDDADIWEQGSGLINLMKADSATVMVDPASISFGVINSSDSLWQKKDTLYLTNTSNDTKIYQVAAENNLPEGANLSFSPGTIEVEPGMSAEVIVTLSVDIDLVPVSDSYPPAYLSSVNIFNEFELFQVPVSFIRGNKLKIDFGIKPDLVYIHDRVSEEYKFSPEGAIFSRPFKSGIYDILAFYNGFNKTVVREGVNISGDIDLQLDPSEAINEVVMKGISPGGKALPVMGGLGEKIMHNESGLNFRLVTIGFYFGTPPKSRKVYFSDLSDAYSYQTSLKSIPSWNDERQFFQFPVFLNKGISSSITCQNDPNDFVKIVTQYESPSKEAKLFYTKGYISIGLGSNYDIYDGLNPEYNTLAYPFIKEEFILPSPHENFVIDAIMYEDIYNLGPEQVFESLDSLTRYYRSPRITSAPNDSGIFVSKYGWNNGFSIANDPYAKINIGQSPPYPDGVPYINNSSISIDHGNFINHYLDMKDTEVIYNLKSQGTLIYSDTIANIRKNNDYNYDRIELPIEHGKEYDLSFSYNDYKVNNVPGTASWNMHFTNNRGYITIPNINALNLTAKGKRKSIFSSNETIDIMFSADSNKKRLFFIKKHDSGNWIEIPLVIEGYSNNIGVIETGLPEGLYSIRITDQAGVFEYNAEPAFHIIAPLTLDSLALVELYNSTQGQNWTNNEGWLQDPLSGWFGINIENNRVVAIDLHSNNLKGTIPVEITDLTDLKKLQLNNNLITYLPDLSKIGNLHTLNVADNRLNFKVLKPNASIKEFNYAPQDSIEIMKIENLETGDTYIYKSSIKDPECHYQWFKDSSEIAYTDTSIFVLDSISLNDSGRYYYTITHETLPDLTLISKPNIVIINKKIFRPVLEGAIVNSTVNTYGGSWGDYDNDGDIDLYISNTNGNNMLYQNTFTDQGFAGFEEALISGEIVERPGNSYGSTWGDIDNDGYLDLFVSLRRPNETNYLFHNQQDGTFVRIWNDGLTDEGKSSYSAAWSDYNTDGNLDIFVANDYYYGYENSINQLFTGNGDGTFQEQNVLNWPNSRFVSWADFDNDNFPDLLTGDTGFLNRNNTDNTFSNIVTDYGFGPVKGASWGDCDNDGDLDLFVIREDKYCSDCISTNSLYRNDGNNTFIKINESGFSADSLSTFGSAWGDYDNDGDLDLVVTNSNGKDLIWKNVFIESGELKFEKIHYGAIYNSEEVSAGCAFADYDQDGDLDIFIASINGKNRLLENMIGSDHNWLKVRCTGTFTNSAAIGAKIHIKTNINDENSWQLREISSQTGFSGQNSLIAHFGVNNASIIDTLVVEWPSGIKQEFTNLNVNQILDITEPSLIVLDPEDVAIIEGSEVDVKINTKYDGSDVVVFSATTDIDDIGLSFEGDTLSINPNEWIGEANISVIASDGTHADSTSFNFTVFEVTDLAPNLSAKDAIVKIFPNPSDGNVTFDIMLDKPSKIAYTIYSSTGKKVLTGQSNNHDIKHLFPIGMSAMRKGLYIVSFQTDHDYFQNKMIIK